MNYPILEFDDDRQAALEPHKLLKPVEDIPQRAVICFFNDVLAALAETGRLEPIRHLGSEMAAPPPEWVPRARVEHIPEATHWVQQVAAERVNALLLEFLAAEGDARG